MKKPKFLVQQNIVSIGTLLIVLSLAYIIIYSSQASFYDKFVNENIELETKTLINDLGHNTTYQKMKSEPLVFNERVYISIKKNVSEKNYYAEGFPFIINKKGDLLLHPKLEGKNIGQYNFGAKITESATESGSFEYYSVHDGTEMILYFKYFQPYNIYACFTAKKDKCYIDFNNYSRQLLFIFFIATILLIYLRLRFNKSISILIQQITLTITKFASNKNSIEISKDSYEETHIIIEAFKSLNQKHKIHNSFAKAISNNNVTNIPDFVEKDDTLMQHLIQINENITISKADEIKRKENDEKQNWLNQGLAKFSEVLRQNTDNIEKHSDNIIQNIVKYVNANQGGIFLLNDNEKGHKHLELISAFAFDSKKFMRKTIPFGEGLIGTCAIEKKTILLKEIPENYISITSGLGEAAPRNILIVPIKLEQEILGVIEIASFYEFEPHKVEFVEKIMNSVASTLASAKINAQTNELLKRFEKQSKEMADKEEIMQQTIEELQSTQEETALKEFELNALLNIYINNCYTVEYKTNGQIINVSKPYIETLGINKSTLLTKNIFDGFAQEFQHDALKIAWKKIINGEIYKQHSTYNSPKGSITFDEIFIPVKTKKNEITKIIKIAHLIN